MKINLKTALFVVFLIVPAAVFGQGSGSSGASPNSGGKVTKKTNFAITRSFSGTVISLNASSIGLKSNDGKTSVFVVNRNTKFVGGRPNIGAKARIIYLAQNRQAVLIRRS